MATFLQLVNSVLVRLRETQVGNITDTPYSTLIGTLVNDAKREVEDSWQWTALFDYVDVGLTSPTSTYNLNTVIAGLSGAPLNDRARIQVDLRKGYAQGYITTPGYESNIAHYQFDTNDLNRLIFANNAETNTPTGFALTPVAPGSVVNGQINKNLQVFPPPDTTYNLRIYFTNAQNDLVNNADVLLVPSAPVILRAYVFALYERGEELGEAISVATARAQASLQDAISHDQNNQAHESGFFVDSFNPAPPFFST